jgi:nucleoside-diphosphate-sugar epimerase
MQRVLVTGADGFTGRVLDPLLAARGWQVVGLRGPQGPDLLDLPALRAFVREAQPQAVVHLAGISFVAHDDVRAIYDANVVGTRNLLQSLHETCTTAPRQVILASSANIYGNSTHEPIGEDAPPQPANDYAVSKLAMEFAASLWRDRLPITVVRPFNYTGRGQAISFLVPKIVEAFRRRAETIELGNLEVERDFTDVRDVADVYVRLLDAAPGGVLNICSGRAVSLREVLAMAQEISGQRLEVRVNPAFVRANEVRRLRGDNARLLQRLPGWQPRPLRETLAWMLADS